MDIQLRENLAPSLARLPPLLLLLQLLFDGGVAEHSQPTARQ